jgi:hypothetical protein
MTRVIQVLQRAVALAVGLVLLAAALVYASLLLALAAAFAIVIGAWLWWRTRALRREARENRAAVIEGEYRIERETERLEEPRR